MYDKRLEYYGEWEVIPDMPAEEHAAFRQIATKLRNESRPLQTEFRADGTETLMRVAPI